jgi:DNA polymerase-3 subunit beta
MKFKIEREMLLESLTTVTSVVERRQTLPILANVFIRLKGSQLTLVGTDLEVEISVDTEALSGEDGECTVTARKLLDICRALPETAIIDFSGESDKAKLRSGRSRFTLQALPPTDFPRLDAGSWEERFKMPQSALKSLFDRTGFSMAQQDVRYFLNGVLLELDQNTITAVATDGHRLARSRATLANSVSSQRQIIVPRKAVVELGRFLGEGSDEVTVEINANHIRLTRPRATLVSKLIDGKFPDYKAVMSQVLNQKMVTDRQKFYEVLARTAVLTNEKYRGIRLELSEGSLKLSAHNPEHEEATDEIPVDYGGSKIEIGFNVTYLMDALKALSTDTVEAELQDSNTGCMLHEPGDDDTLYLIMPMRL